jgi:hypothetical protein
MALFNRRDIADDAVDAAMAVLEAEEIVNAAALCPWAGRAHKPGCHCTSHMPEGGDHGDR